MNTESYADARSTYFAHTRHDVIGVIPVDVKGRMLEIGCGRGHTLLALKEAGRASEVVGVEIAALPRTESEIAGVDRYIVGDIEKDRLDLQPSSFDVVICADVLEHLRDPWAAVSMLNGLLREGGVLVASVPNVREVRTLYNVFVRGDFAYAQAGVLDRTHVRFFCKQNILGLLTVGGGKVERVSDDLATRSNWRACLNRVTFGLLEQFLVTQYLVVVRK